MSRVSGPVCLLVRVVGSGEGPDRPLLCNGLHLTCCVVVVFSLNKVAQIYGKAKLPPHSQPHKPPDRPDRTRETRGKNTPNTPPDPRTVTQTQE